MHQRLGRAQPEQRSDLRRSSRPRGRSQDELRESVSLESVRFRNRMMDHALGETTKADDDYIDDIGIMVYGWGLLISCVVVGGCLLYWLGGCVLGGGAVRKATKPDHHYDEFSVGEYYSCLAVLSIPVFVLFVYWNWVSMKAVSYTHLTLPTKRIV
eukprot:TRINITY_DN19863_c0_g1_i4.p1 TRINITY_DN19863_c0_g1~~TRINITY_DN19863_c0_g1_i4.p1  ORF type:complete len:156 (+),score=16.18 TRINITY_DN19863_c0_g1_i4:231-698(+)